MGREGRVGANLVRGGRGGRPLEMRRVRVQMGKERVDVRSDVGRVLGGLKVLLLLGMLRILLLLLMLMLILLLHLLLLMLLLRRWSRH